MTADVTPDRRVTVPTLGFTDTVLVDGSRLFWASLSPMHERLGFRAIEPDRIQGDAVLPHISYMAQSRITFRRSCRAQPSRPSSLAPCSAPSRPLRAASGGGLRPALTASARGAPNKRWSGRRNPSVEQRNFLMKRTTAMN